MTEQVKVDLQDNSPYRVALDLALSIANHERGGMWSGEGTAPKQDRDYWLKLYLQCRSVVLSNAQRKD